MKKDVLAFCGNILFLLLQFALYMLKQNEVINWSWWLVMLPTLICLVIAAIFVLAVIWLALIKARNDTKIERLKKEAREKKYF